MIKAIAFDFDHTLYDRWVTYDNMVDDFMRFFADYLRPGISREEVRFAIKDSDKNSFRVKFDPEKTVSTRGAAMHWARIYNATLASGIFAKEPDYDTYYFDFIERYFPPAIELFPETKPLMEELSRKGYTTGILTNGPADYQKAKLEAVGMYEMVDRVVLCGDLPWQKPHSTAFEAICREMGCAPHETIYVGDNPLNDIDGARKVGITPVWIKTVGVWPEDLTPAPYSIDTLDELLPLLGKIEQDLDR